IGCCSVCCEGRGWPCSGITVTIRSLSPCYGMHSCTPWLGRYGLWRHRGWRQEDTENPGAESTPTGVVSLSALPVIGRFVPLLFVAAQGRRATLTLPLTYRRSYNNAHHPVNHQFRYGRSQWPLDDDPLPPLLLLSSGLYRWSCSRSRASISAHSDGLLVGWFP